MCCRSCSNQSDKHNQIRASECSKSPEYEPSEALGTDTDILRAFTVSEQPSSSIIFLCTSSPLRSLFQRKGSECASDLLFGSNQWMKGSIEGNHVSWCMEGYSGHVEDAWFI